MMELDIKYARTKTLWLDLKIIFKTVPALVIQMWDTWVKKNSRQQLAQSRSADTGRSGSNGVCLSDAAFMTVVSAGTDTEHRRK